MLTKSVHPYPCLPAQTLGVLQSIIDHTDSTLGNQVPRFALLSGPTSDRSPNREHDALLLKHEGCTDSMDLDQGSKGCLVFTCPRRFCLEVGIEQSLCEEFLEVTLCSWPSPIWTLTDGGNECPGRPLDRWRNCAAELPISDRSLGRHISRFGASIGVVMPFVLAAWRYYNGRTLLIDTVVLPSRYKSAARGSRWTIAR